MLCARIEDGLIAIEERVRHRGSVIPPRSVRPPTGFSGLRVARCFVTTVRKGYFSWDFDSKARRYDEELLCGRYVITTSLSADEVGCAQVLRYYRSLQTVERRFRVMKDFLPCRPRSTGPRPGCADTWRCACGGHHRGRDDPAGCGKVIDPNMPFQPMTPRRALAELAEVRLELVSAGERTIELVSRPDPTPGQGASGPRRGHLRLG